MPRPLLALGVAPVLFLALACAPVDDSSTTATDTRTPPATAASASADPAACAADAVRTPGTLTIGTDSPAYDPWFSKNDPTNGKGFESAVAYAVAEQARLHRRPGAVDQGAVQHSYAPGAQGRSTSTSTRSRSRPSAPRSSTSPTATTPPPRPSSRSRARRRPASPALADLKGLKLGAQTGTTSLTAIRDVIKPDADPLVFDDTNAAKQALLNDQVDAILADLPTAFYITAVEIPKSTIVGQFQPETGQQEEFGMLFEKGSTLVPVRQPGARRAQATTAPWRPSRSSWLVRRGRRPGPHTQLEPTAGPQRRGRSSATRVRRRLRPPLGGRSRRWPTVVVLGLLVVVRR